jgi:hypothetical protein
MCTIPSCFSNFNDGVFFFCECDDENSDLTGNVSMDFTGEDKFNVPFPGDDIILSFIFLGDNGIRPGEHYQSSRCSHRHIHRKRILRH